MDDFLETFPILYGKVSDFSSQGAIRTSTLIEVGKKTGRLVGEFFAANGVALIDFAPLSDSIQITRSFLSTGRLDTSWIETTLSEVDLRMMSFGEILLGMAESEEVSKNCQSGPMVLFIYGYASLLLGGLKETDAIKDYPTRNNRIGLLREMQIQIDKIIADHGPKPAA